MMMRPSIALKSLIAAVALMSGMVGCASSPSGCTNVPGAVVGGVAGGLVGSAVGGGTGRDLAIGAGAATGAVVGSNYGC
jgi:outer membrane lipoprotein SlyB